MLFDTTSIPIGGNTVLAFLAFAVTSVAAGQVMTSRMIEKSGWYQTCPQMLIAEVPRPKQFKRKTPKMTCSDTVGLFGREFSALCMEFDNPDFNGQAARIERELFEKQQEVYQRRVERIQRNASSRCSCASTTYLQDNWWQLGVYAGTARQVSLPPVANRPVELRKHLAAPLCAGLPGDAS